MRAKGKFAKASRTTLLLFCIDAITVFLALRDTQRAKVAASKTPSGTVSVSSFLLTRSVCVCVSVRGSLQAVRHAANHSSQAHLNAI